MFSATENQAIMNQSYYKEYSSVEITGELLYEHPRISFEYQYTLNILR